MAAERSPWFPFYAKDWRDVKVRRMSLAAQGAYMAILADMWVDSKDRYSILDCDPFLAKSLGVSLEEWRTIRTEIQHTTEPLLVEKDGRLQSRRLKREAQKQHKYAIKQAHNANKRWEQKPMPPHDSGISQRDAKRCSSSSSSSSLKSKSKTKDLVSPPKGDKSVDKSEMPSELGTACPPGLLDRFKKIGKDMPG